MVRTNGSTPGTESPALEVVLDAAILGVSAVYPSQRAGIWRFLRGWTKELASRDDVRLHLVSSGRAPWNELALERTRLEDPFFAQLPHVWHSRSSVLPGWRLLQSHMSKIAFRLARRGLPPTVLAGALQVLQTGLGRLPTPVSRGVYHSPYHALPESVAAVPGLARSLTVHDLIPVLFPQWFDDTQPFRRTLDSLRPGDHVFAVSECTRSDLIRMRGLDPEHVHVAYQGISPIFVARDRAWCRSQMERIGLPDVRFLLAVGTLEPRKNLPALLEVFRQIAETPGQEDLHLVLAGARGWKNEVYDRVLEGLGESRHRVIATGFLPDADLPVLYGGCEAFVYPSLYEGFGLPIAEAMACGAAVVCVRNSSQPEVAGEVAEMADTADAGSIVRALSELLANGDRLASMRARGPGQAARFTWARCVDAYLDVWNSVVESAS